jgi:hypothetical protein
MTHPHEHTSLGEQFNCEVCMLPIVTEAARQSSVDQNEMFKKYNNMTQPHTDAEIVSMLSQCIRYFTGKGQYEEGSEEQKAYLDGVETAIGMMCIDLIGTPKTVGILSQVRKEAYEEGKRDERESNEFNNAFALSDATSKLQ